MRNFFLILLMLTSLAAHAQGDKAFEKAFKAYENGNYEKALELFNEMERTQGSNREFFLFRGICFSETGNDVKAIADYNKALEIDTNYAEAYNQRGFSFFSQGNDSLAIRDFDKAILLNPDMVETYMNRGSAKYDAGDLDGACADWKTASDKGLGIVEQLIDQLCK